MSPDTKTTYKENFEYHDLSVKQMQLVERKNSSFSLNITEYCRTC